VALLWLSALLLAPATTGSLAGRVSSADSKGGLGSATVVVIGPSVERAEVTGEDGSYRFAELSPGRYSVTFYYADVRLRRDRVRVRAGKEARLDVALSELPEWHPAVTLSASRDALAACEDVPPGAALSERPLGSAGGMSGTNVMSSFFETTSTGFFEATGASLPPRSQADPVLQLHLEAPASVSVGEIFKLRLSSANRSLGPLLVLKGVDGSSASDRYSQFDLYLRDEASGRISAGPTLADDAATSIGSSRPTTPTWHLGRPAERSPMGGCLTWREPLSTRRAPTPSGRFTASAAIARERLLTIRKPLFTSVCMRPTAFACASRAWRGRPAR
jgi:hypothetical protein